MEKLGIAVAFIALLSTSPARAWDDAPLCAFDPAALGVQASVWRDASATPSRGTSLPTLEVGPMCRAEQPTTSRVVDDAAARAAWARASVDESDDALLALDTVAAALPRLEDRVALRRGEILLARGEPAEATRAFERAARSVDASLALRAEVARVRALFAASHRGAGEALATLVRRYPDLPEEPELRLLEANEAFARGDTAAGITRLRVLDIRFPGTMAGRQARERLLALERAGTASRALTDLQRVERAERLVRFGPLDEAKRELGALESEGLHATLRPRVHSLLGRIARHEGRWADAERHLALARGPGAADEPSADAERALDMAAAARSREVERTRAELRRLGWRDALALQRRVPSGRLLLLARVAARADLRAETDAILAEMLRRNLPPRVRLDAALSIVGSADDEAIVSLLEGTDALPGTHGVQGLYHRARALERVGRLAEAEVAFLEVRRRDRGAAPWYALLAELRIDEVHAGMIAACGPSATCTRPVGELAGAPLALPSDARLASLSPSAVGGAPAEARLDAPAHPRRPSRHEGLVDPALLPPAPRARAVDGPALAARLEPLVERHGEAFPWLGRAADLLQLGEHEDAGRQLYEAFLAWREAAGRPIRRTGLVSVARGAERPRVATPFPLRRARRALGARDRAELVSIATALGDFGASTGFGGWAEVGALPRAYEAEVEEAARRHGVDPNLLFAVMRVESVYQKEIVSYAGAIGLCQIMPRTGTLIARAQGRDDFTTADLLDPNVNLDFAAWYLRSLIERFEGRLPLAIASYNGGPHNVRRWLRDHPTGMPLDAFVEHIPFGQTHRYVRRVLTFYAAYRAQQGLPMISLSNDLPDPPADRVGF
ncbi:MAG: transglycosylase SLT domain-containing protein [Myxococcales bacterium]|nr:transglycosylase SLT domain-containing protein [Myxococcales bacterium]